MTFYVLKRLLLIIPTLFGIMLVNFAIIHIAPGGPIDYVLSKMNSEPSAESLPRTGDPRGSWNQEMIEELNKRYGFDQPFWKRFFIMIKNYLCFDLGKSYFKHDSVSHLIFSRLPVSLSLGLWSTLIIYLVSIPLGMIKAVKNGSSFDIWTSVLVMVGYAIPSFLFALGLVVLFAGGSFWSFFPLRGLVSSCWEDLSWWGKIKDYFWHLSLPIIAQVLSGFASLTLLTKNSFLEEIHKPYVLAARAQGLSEKALLFKTIFRNAMILVIAGFPATVMGILFSGSLLIEMIFSLEGLGLLGYEAIMTRDYPIIFGSLYFFTLIGLMLHLITDILYTWVDPRIDFNKRNQGG